VKDFNVEDYIPAKEARNMDTFIHFGIAAGMQAFQDSGMVVTEENAERRCYRRFRYGGLPLIEATKETLIERGPRRISPFFRASVDHQHDFG
jgi:3-oxoacyl-[acyl-carrier-protein] synthase II